MRASMYCTPRYLSIYNQFNDSDTNLTARFISVLRFTSSSTLQTVGSTCWKHPVSILGLYPPNRHLFNNFSVAGEYDLSVPVDAYVNGGLRVYVCHTYEFELLYR